MAENICEMLRRVALRTPDRPALIERERVVSFGALYDTIERTATLLRAADAVPGNRIGLCLKVNIDHLIVFLGAARLGAVPLTIDWRAPATEKTRIARAFDLPLVMCESDQRAIPGCNCAVLDESWHDDVRRAPALSGAGPANDAPLMIMSTSGTSGAAKGFVVDHGQFQARMRRAWAGYEFRPGDRYLSATPFNFAVGRQYPLIHLLGGNTVILHPPVFGAEEFVDAVNRSEATVSFAVPTVLRWLFKLDAGDGHLMPGLKTLCVAGERLDANDKRRAIHAISENLYAAYGTTGIGVVAVLTPRDAKTNPASVGRVLPAVDVEIVNDDDVPVATEERGRLRCRGPGLARPVSAREEGPSNEGVVDGWYYPGDIASIDREGFIYLHGRGDDVIIRGGVNVSTSEVEDALREHAGVADAAAVARQSDTVGHDIVAFVVAEQRVSTTELLTHCRQHLTAVKVPSSIMIVDSLPRGRTGKVDRVALRRQVE